MIEVSGGLLEEVRGLVGALEAELLAASLGLGLDQTAWSVLCGEASIRTAEVIAAVIPREK